MKYYKFERAKGKLEIEKLFDNQTMSLHLKEDNYAFAKKGKPGDWELVKVSKKKYNKKAIEEIAKEIVEKSRIDSEAFVEISVLGYSSSSCLLRIICNNIIGHLCIFFNDNSHMIFRENS